MRPWTLLRRSLAQNAALLAGVVLILAGFQVGLVLVASSYDQAHSFERLALLAPSFMQRSLGSSLQTFVSFSGVVSLGYFHPLATIAVVMNAMYVATELAADVESGMVDLVLGRPLARHHLVTRSAAHALTATVVIVATMCLATTLALHAFAPANARGPGFTTLAQLAVYLVALASCFGALALAASAFARRRSSAMAGASLVALTLYLLELIAPLWSPARLMAWTSPFHYFPGVAIITGSNVPTRDLAVLGALAVLGTLVAYRAFATRDL